MSEKFLNSKFIFSSLAILLIAGYGFLLFYKLGSHPIVDWDEGIYAQVARQSFENHTIADLYYYGTISPQNPTGLWFEKPPLMIWLIEFSYLIFGVTEFAARFWSAFFALGIVILSYYFAVRLFKSRVVGLMTLATFYLAHFFITQSWYLKFDIPVTFFILLSFFSFERARNNKKFFLLFWTAVGLGVLTKSVIGLLPLPIIAIYALIRMDSGFLKERYFYYGALLCLAIILPWHLIETFRYGTNFWKTYFGYHILERYAKPLEAHSGSFWYYALQMKDNLILAGLSVVGLANFLWRAVSDKNNKRGHLLIAIQVIFIFLFFSAAGTKLAGYMSVIYPFLIIMVAKTIYDIFFLNKNNLFRVIGLSTISLLFVVSAFIFNASKINDNGYFSHYYYEDKAFMQFALQNYPNLNILVYHRDLPALIFYADKRVYIWSPATKISPGSLIFISPEQPPYSDAKLIARGQTASLYLVTVQ